MVFLMSSNPTYDYIILGSGRQGTAAAYDLARFGNAGRIVLADVDIRAANRAVKRINELVGRSVAEAQLLDVSDRQSLIETLGPFDAAMSAVPFYYNLEITLAALKAGTHLCDLGGHTDVVLTQLALDKEAHKAAVCVVPDCGMGPGLNNTLASYAMGFLDEPQEVSIYDAGLPRSAEPPWNYQLTFHINGLTNEMDGQAVYLRDGKIVRLDTLSEPEYIDFQPLGKLEADITSGGTSSAPWIYEGKLKRYEVKTLRYPGHFEWLRAFKTLGLFSENPIPVDGVEIIPRQVFHALLEPKIKAPHIQDVAIIRAVVKGIKAGRNTKITVDLIDYFDKGTGFTAMERLTGWHCAIMMGFLVRGQVSPGVTPVELAVPGNQFMDEVRRRGIQFEVRIE
jgi:lysine 6-dehydrogenase